MSAPYRPSCSLTPILNPRCPPLPEFGLPARTRIGSNCFHGMTLYNDMVLDRTEVVNVSRFAFAGVTVNRDFNWTDAVRFPQSFAFP